MLNRLYNTSLFLYFLPVKYPSQLSFKEMNYCNGLFVNCFLAIPNVKLNTNYFFLQMLIT